MSEQVKVTYEGIEIVLDEDNNRWYWTQDGRDRSAETLANAKKAIDTPAKERKPKFEPITAWRKD